MDFWIEGTDGTRLGETRYVTFRQKKMLLDRYEVYDAEDRLQAIIRSLEGTAPTEWLINNPQDQQLAIGKRSSGLLERHTYQILANDESIIAEMHRKRDFYYETPTKSKLHAKALTPS